MKKIPVYGIREFSEGDKAPYFYSSNLRTHLEKHHFVNAPHKHSTYISVLFTKGTGEHLIDFEKHSVKPGAVFLLNPGQIHSWKLSKETDGYVFIHTKEFYDTIFVNRKVEDFPFFYLQKNYPVIYLTDAECKRIRNLFGMVNEEFADNAPYRMEKLGSLTDLLYLELTRIYKPKEKKLSRGTPNYLKVKNLQRLIDEHFKTLKSPNEYADLMNISPRHLNRICRETLSKTSGDLIFDRIILEAKRMLVHSDISIAQLAGQLGYEDTSYFIRLFKKRTGTSPKAFQTKMNTPLQR